MQIVKGGQLLIAEHIRFGMAFDAINELLSLIPEQQQGLIVKQEQL